jgi:glycine betaine catabolism A
MTASTVLPPHTQAFLARICAQCREERAEWQDCSDAEGSVQVERYTSQAIYQQEVQALFRGLPLIAGHSSELGLGQVLAHDAFGLPILLSRDLTGVLRAHLNVCRHRGTRLLEAGPAQTKNSIVCPYHGWTYQLNGQLRHRLHAASFDPKPCEQEDLVALPCTERHGLIWVIASAAVQPAEAKAQSPFNYIRIDSTTKALGIDIDAYLGELSSELPFYEIEQLTHFRTVEAEYDANWKLIVDAFLESYHIRVLHKDTIAPFFTDGITAGAQFGDVPSGGPHIHSLVARKAALAWAKDNTAAQPQNMRELCELVTPSSVLFPNTITIFHPDYLSLITLFPLSAGRLRWTHKMLIPKDRASADWTPHWEKTFNLIEKGVFQKEDIHTAVQIQQGFASGANTALRLGRIEQAVGWFHTSVQNQLNH